MLPRNHRSISTLNRPSAVCSLALCLLVLQSSPIDAQPGSLTELLDFQGAPRLKKWVSQQASGYDRLGGFYDSGNFLRVDPGPRYVLLDVSGPGVIDRMWFTSKGKSGTEPYDLLIYVDGAATPVICEDIDRLCSGARPPFVAPLVGHCGNPEYPGRYCYVPIGFRSSCRVVLQPTAKQEEYHFRQNSAGETIPHVYYQITYRLIPDGLPVSTFDWELSSDELGALERIREVWSQPGAALTAARERCDVQVSVPPGATTDAATILGAGTITAVTLRTDQPDSLRLQFWWDESAEPAVDVPFGPFFGCCDGELGTTAARGVWFGYHQGDFYNLFPMPFRNGARLNVTSLSDRPIELRGSVAYDSNPPDALAAYLHAERYDFNPPTAGEDYVVLDTQGPGHFVGLVMDRPGNMEGDDRFFVDRNDVPALHGTGTEDFFNFAWGLSHVGSYPLHGISAQPSGPCCYRVMLPGAVPFEHSLRIVWEHGHDPRSGANRDQRRYSGVAFYYRREP